MKLVNSRYFILFMMALCPPAFSQDFTSTTQATQLIELYTSEGCSSCPPADRWLNNLKNNPDLWSKFIPMAFHVDYWDYIGWKDPFAKPEFSARQRQYARQANLSSVYTPGMLLNGREWTGWRKQSRLKQPSSTPSTGILSLTINNGNLNANYQTKTPAQSGLVLNIALLGFDVKSTVDAGENTGHTFTHDFVVLGFKHIAMKQVGDGNYIGSLDTLPELSQSSTKLALSSWVNTKNSLTPLQAVGGWIK